MPVAPSSGRVAFFTSLRRLGRGIGRVAATRYPRFVFGLAPDRHEIPVFVYHDVEARAFASDLTFLRDNGYRTVSTAEFVSRDGRQDRDRLVLLTFDDARQSFWTVAFPLLREFDARATLFAPSGWIRGAQDGADAAGPPADRSRFVTWDELRACVDSGLVDVQSHAHRHALVYQSARMLAFASPQLLSRQHIFDWPMRCDGGEALGRPALGVPIYEAAPLLSAQYRVLEDAALTAACREMVAAAGGEDFFANRAWADKLRALQQAIAGRKPAPTVQEGRDFGALVYSEFLLSRRRFEMELGAAPHFFAFPWMLGSGLSMSLAKETGIVAIFGVGLDFRRARAGKEPLPTYARIKADWLRFLPGRGRRRLQQVIPAKLADFFGSQPLAH